MSCKPKDVAKYKTMKFIAALHTTYLKCVLNLIPVITFRGFSDKYMLILATGQQSILRADSRGDLVLNCNGFIGKI